MFSPSLLLMGTFSTSSGNFQMLKTVADPLERECYQHVLSVRPVSLSPSPSVCPSSCATAANVHRYLNLFCSRGDDRRVSRFKRVLPVNYTSRYAARAAAKTTTTRKLFQSRHASQRQSPPQTQRQANIDKCVCPSSLHRRLSLLQLVLDFGS